MTWAIGGGLVALVAWTVVASGKRGDAARCERVRQAAITTGSIERVL